MNALFIIPSNMESYVQTIEEAYTKGYDLYIIFKWI
jgi:hypothetical protein